MFEVDEFGPEDAKQAPVKWDDKDVESRLALQLSKASASLAALVASDLPSCNPQQAQGKRVRFQNQPQCEQSVISRDWPMVKGVLQ